MEGSCCPPGQSCGILADDKVSCNCGREWTCVIKKINVDAIEAVAKPFYNCSTEGCVCITDDKHKAHVVNTDGGYCECAEGYMCIFTQTEGPDAGKVFLGCGNGCKCEIPGSNGIVALKEA
uniref:Uncharacterized protein n=1 Tax=Opuntia streptacantha TaxID=393608 RepID=A0A7C8YJC3_OPUST